MSRGFFGKMFDLNHDGKLSSFERAMDFMAFEETLREDNDSEDELEMAGLDYDELSLMDEEERREIIEEAGLDPDDYDF